jgi:hypothetical protein
VWWMFVLGTGRLIASMNSMLQIILRMQQVCQTVFRDNNV